MDGSAVAELTGYADFGTWCPIGGFEVLIESTKRAKRVRIRVRPKPSRTGKVRVLKRSPHAGRNLTEGDISI